MSVYATAVIAIRIAVFFAVVTSGYFIKARFPDWNAPEWSFWATAAVGVLFLWLGTPK